MLDIITHPYHSRKFPLQKKDIITVAGEQGGTKEWRIVTISSMSLY